MLNSTDSLRAFLGVEPIDLPKSFSGLFAVAMRRFKEDPLQGALLVFSNRSRTRFKMLYWDGTGLWVLVKRSEFDLGEITLRGGYCCFGLHQFSQSSKERSPLSRSSVWFSEP